MKPSPPSPASPSPDDPSFRRSCYIWYDAEGRGRSNYALFRRTFTLAGEPRTSLFRLFADRRYRLYVNGTVIGHGPARFFLKHPLYDEYDLRPHLRPGPNALAIIVNSCEGISFQAEPSRGALRCWGLAVDSQGEQCLASGPAWHAIRSPAYLSHGSYLSFALYPGEFYDARQLSPEWVRPDFAEDWPPAVRLADQDRWGPLQPRYLPHLDEGVAGSLAFQEHWLALPDEDRKVYSFRIVGTPRRPQPHREGAVAYTWLHAASARRVRLRTTESRIILNGRALPPDPRTAGQVPLSFEFEADLREGPNLLFFLRERFAFDAWTCYLSLPASPDLALSSSRQNAEGPHVFGVGGPWDEERRALAEAHDWLSLTDPLLPDTLGPWTWIARDTRAECPHTDFAWKTLAPRQDSISLREARTHGGSLDPANSPSRVLVLDCGHEVLGRPRLRFRARAGTRVDLFYSERLLENGTVHQYFRDNVEMAERVIARDGEQEWYSFHPKGFRYLQVVVTGFLEDFDLLQGEYTRANYPTPRRGSFECSDPELTRIWALGRDTLHACMEDSYLDTPMRERGVYVGDALVEFAVDTVAFGDARIMRRTLEILVQGQGENGLIPGGAHGLPPGRYPDYSAIWVIALREYVRQTGDLDFAEAMRSRLTRLLDGFDLLWEPATGLAQDAGLEPYIDLSRTTRRGILCSLNGFLVWALRSAAELFQLLGAEEEAAPYRHQAWELSARMRRHFLDPETGLFRDSASESAPYVHSVAGNALAYLSGVATGTERAAIAGFIAGRIRDSLPKDRNMEERTDVETSAYFSFFVLRILLEENRVEDAVDFIRKYWGRMSDNGAWACWEYLDDFPQASRCHAWAAAPTYYLTTAVLGIRFEGEAGVEGIRLRPHPLGLAWARGSVWLPDGRECRVAWRREGDGLRVEYSASPDLVVVCHGDTPEPTAAAPGPGACTSTFLFPATCNTPCPLP